MPRTVRDTKLESRAARDRVTPRAKPHWKTLIPNQLHLGYRRKSKELAGTWLVRRYIGDQRYRTTRIGIADDHQDADEETFISYAEAQRRAHAEGERARKEGSDKPSGPITVKDAVAAYVDYLNVERKTGRDAERRAAALILPELGKLKVSDLTTPLLRNWFHRLAESGARVRTKPGEEQRFRVVKDPHDAKRQRRATANRILTILKAALNRAYSDGLVEAQDVWRKVKPFAEVQAARERFLEITQAVRLIEFADAKSGFQALVRGALETGCRYGELGALDVKDFEHGKLRIGVSKSGKPRIVRLTEDGERFFASLCSGRPDGEPMFKRPDGGRWQEFMQARPMRAACLAAGIEPIGFHQLRHTWASHAVMNGVPLSVVAKNLGHSTTIMVEKHYGHLSDTYLDDAIRAGAPRFGAPSPPPETDPKVVALRSVAG